MCLVSSNACTGTDAGRAIRDFRMCDYGVGSNAKLVGLASRSCCVPAILVGNSCSTSHSNISVGNSGVDKVLVRGNTSVVRKRDLLDPCCGVLCASVPRDGENLKSCSQGTVCRAFGLPLSEIGGNGGVGLRCAGGDNGDFSRWVAIRGDTRRVRDATNSSKCELGMSGTRISLVSTSGGIIIFRNASYTKPGGIRVVIP